MLKPVEKPIKFIKNLSTKGKSYPITHVSAVIDDNGESIKSTIDSLKNKALVTKVTWQELKDKRDNGKLIPGSLYRITDYQCTTTQKNTRSAGHQFDIVLLALSENKLAEEGWAMMHSTDVYDVTFSDEVTKKCYYYRYQSGMDRHDVLVYTDTLLGFDYNSGTDDDLDNFINETNKTIDLSSTPITSELLNVPNLTYNYFQNSNLSAWKVWYCLDNDTARFAWADDREGYLISGQSQFGIWDNRLVLRAPGWDAGDIYGWKIVGTDAGIFTKTLDINVGQLQIYNSSGNLMDVATVSSAIKVYNGRGVIYRLIDEFNNDVPYDFKNIQFVRKLTDGEYDPDSGEDTWVHTFTWLDEDGEAVDASVFCQNIAGDEGFVYGVHDNSMLPCIEYDFYPEEHSDKLAFALNDNVFISSYEYEGGVFYGIYGNHFGSSCYSNTFGNSFSINTFGNYCQNNTFGNDCYNNSFGNSCGGNTFGNNCYDNTFGNDCGNNKFGNDCFRNTFGNNCYDNTFGNGCQNNTFGNYCSGNSFGNNFLSSSIGDNVNNVKVNKDYVQFILIENGNQYITITSTATTSSSSYLRNFTVSLGVNNSNTVKTISHNTVNDTFLTEYKPANSQVISI